jgi:hypothetical protein
MFAIYEQHGQPLEVLLQHYIQARFVRPRTRVYQTEAKDLTLGQVKQELGFDPCQILGNRHICHVNSPFLRQSCCCCQLRLTL